MVLFLRRIEAADVEHAAAAGAGERRGGGDADQRHQRKHGRQEERDQRGGDAAARRFGWSGSKCPLKLVNYELLTRDADLVADESVRFDVVVLATKGYDNRWSALFARDLLAPDGILISAQNGLHERYLPAVIGDDRLQVLARDLARIAPGGPLRPIW